MASSIIAKLGDDFLHEIFLRLPSPADLLRTALACRPFLRAARNPAFLRRFRRLHPTSCPLLLGCAVLPLPLHDSNPLLLPVSAAAKQLVGEHGAGGDFALSFLPRGGWSAAWQFLDCRNGRLLLKNQGAQELAVADPLARSCIPLPSPPAEHPVGYGLVADDGDTTAFRVVCIARDSVSSSRLCAMVFSSGRLSWADVANLSCQPNLAGCRAMQANGSLYWRLEGTASMLAFHTAKMEFSVVKLPHCLQELSFDVTEKGGEHDNGIYVITMRGFCIEVWAGADDGARGHTWMRVEKSVRFQKVMIGMFGQMLYQHGLDVIGVVAGVVLLHHCGFLLSIDLETMKMRKVSEENYSSALIYPYTMAWPPPFLNPSREAA